jgi:hypothetical protein
MQTIRRMTGSRVSRLGWGLALLGLGAVLFLTFVFGWSAVGGQQRAAQARSVRDTTKPPLSGLSPSQVSKPIVGEAAKNLRNGVGSKILSDSRVARIRIWSLDGTLVFSSDSGDKLGVARLDTQPFRSAVSGRIASVLTTGPIPATGGLSGLNERAYVTFAPLRLENQARAAAVVEVDQRYASILAAANVLWRPVQLAVIVLMILSLMMLILSLRGGRRMGPTQSAEATGAAGPGFAPSSSRPNKELEGRVRAAEESLRSAEARLTTAEREKRRIAERLVAAQEQLALMTAAAKGNGPKGGEGEGSKQIRKLEQERDRMAAEIRQLQAALEAGSAGGSSNKEDDSVGRSAKRDTKTQAHVAELEAALSDAEAKAASLESAARQMEEERRHATAGLDAATEAAAKHEAEVGRLSEEIAALKKKGSGRSKGADTAELTKAEGRVRQAEERAMKAVSGATQAEERAKQAEQKLKEAEDRAGAFEALSRQSEERAREAENRATQAVEEAKAAAAGFQEQLEAAEERAAEPKKLASQAEERLRQAEARVAQLETGSTEMEGRAVAAEQRVAQLQTVTKQAEERMSQLEAGARRAEQHAVEADMRVRELEDERAELGAEVETVRAGRGAKDAETTSKTEAPSGEATTRVRELEAERARLSAELEKALAVGSTTVAVGSEAELAARIEELEARRRQDVSELQQVREALANTQLELTAAVKRSKDTESLPEAEGSRELFARAERKSGPPKRSDDASPQPEEESSASPVSQSSRRKSEAQGTEADEEAAASWPSEGLSLRERLARAAAARHWSSPSGDKGKG